MKMMSFILREMRLVALVCIGMAAGTAIAQETEDVPFNGIISDLEGKPLKGAVIWTTNERRYAVSNKKGQFGLTNVQAEDTIHIEYKKLKYDIPVEGRKSARIRLANENSHIDEDQELVDIGYGFVKRRECTISNRLSSTSFTSKVTGRSTPLRLSLRPESEIVIMSPPTFTLMLQARL